MNHLPCVPTLPLFALAAAGLLCVAPVRAADEARGSLLQDRFMVSLGTFLLDTKTELSLNGSAGSAGTAVDFERDLGLKDSNRFRLDATWRFSPRHKLRAMYFNTSQSRTRTLDRELVVGDTTYPLRAEISADSATTILELAYEYVFLRKPDYEVAGSAGVHRVGFDFGLGGRGTVAGQPGQFRRETAVANAPLPVIGLRGLWQFSPDWYFDGQVQYFTLSVDGFDGDITDLRVGVTRMFGRHVGVGAGWNQFITNVGVDRDRFRGKLDWRYSGAQLFVTASF